VVIPLYQKRSWIARCLDSVQAQTVRPYEVIVIDDGSTDGGGEVALGYLGPGWRCIRQDNAGVAAARNAGLALASGSHVAFLDADDTWSPDHLAELSRLARSHPDATILGTAWAEDGTPNVDNALASDPSIIDLDRYIARAVANLPPFWTSAVAIRRGAVVEPNPFPVGSRIAEDQDAWLTHLFAGPGVRSLKVTACYWTDPLAPTISAPRLADFDSVIFRKWATDPRFQAARFVDFVASHRLYTIERHAGQTAAARLLRELLRTRTRRLWPRKLRAAVRVLRLGALGHSRRGS
jgi:glycosyltransferase involved in cell wall biosynthesis